MKLYHFPISPNSRRVIAVLQQLNLDCELVTLDLVKGEQMQPAFIAMNPNHMIPTLEDNDFVLWESNAIMQYLCSKVPDNQLLPADSRLHADVLRWQFWQTAHFGRACGMLIFENILKQALDMGEPEANEIAKGEESFHRFAQVLETHLQDRHWLVSDHHTLADFSVGSFLDLAEKARYPIAEYANIQRWYQSIEQLPAWQNSAPDKTAN